MSVRDQSEEAVEAARDAGILTDADGAAIAALYHLAEMIDSQVDGMTPDGKLDNVSVPTFLKYAEALGLTPLSRSKIQAVMKESAKGEGADRGDKGSGLGKFRAIAGGKSA